MHYTSIENIHKVIDPLFLDELREDLDWALAYKRDSERKSALVDFQKKISSLKFFDPACGSGNFLTETYLSLRRLENEAIRAFGKDQISLDPSWLIKVNINQFYGIEIVWLYYVKSAFCWCKINGWKSEERTKRNI